MESLGEGWIGFGTKYQSYQRPYKWSLGKTGIVWEIDHKGSRTRLKNPLHEDRYATLEDIKKYKNGISQEYWEEDEIFWYI